MGWLWLPGLISSLWLVAVYGGEADVLSVQATRDPDGTYQFEVTVQHADEGWKHYADKWEVLSLDGRIIATRTLYHPHVNEQPFTRSLSAVRVPSGIDAVTIRAHDSMHQYGGHAVTVELSP